MEAIILSAMVVVQAGTAADFDVHAFRRVVMDTYGRFPIAMHRGEGCTLTDTQDKNYLDFAAGISTCTLGHANDKLAAAVSQQMHTLTHVSNLYYIPNQGKLAQRLVDSSCLDRAFFCNSGAEANEAAIKLARKYAVEKLQTNKPVIVTAQNSFHGRTLGAISATGQPKYQKGFGELLSGFEYVHYNDVDDLRRLARKFTSNRFIPSLGPKSRLAAIMLEPLQGEGGIVPGTTEFFTVAREICDATGALLIVDEVQTGVGRTGQMWGYQNLGVEVDVLTSAKGLGGGVPIGAMLCKSHCDVFSPGTHASTFGGNPLACAAGNAVLDAIEEDELIKNVRERSEQLKQGLKEIEARLGCISEIRGWGLLLGIQLSDDCGFDAASLCNEAITNGLLSVPAGTHVLRLVPPLVVSARDVDEALTKLETSILSLKK